jgi:hypothetical protein
MGFVLLLLPAARQDPCQQQQAHHTTKKHISNLASSTPAALCGAQAPVQHLQLLLLCITQHTMVLRVAGSLPTHTP